MRSQARTTMCFIVRVIHLLARAETGDGAEMGRDYFVHQRALTSRKINLCTRAWRIRAARTRRQARTKEAAPSKSRGTAHAEPLPLEPL